VKEDDIGRYLGREVSVAIIYVPVVSAQEYQALRGILGSKIPDTFDLDALDNFTAEKSSGKSY
jgi:hypothetical protein